MMTADVIREFILSELVQDKSITTLSEKDSLIESGIIDSLGIQKLLIFIEEKISIQIMDEDIIPENFETIEAIVRLIESKMPPSTPMRQ
jgi:acyl carrier protein